MEHLYWLMGNQFIGRIVYSRGRERILQQLQIFFGGINLATADEQDERSYVPVGAFQGFDVFRAENGKNDGDRMLALGRRKKFARYRYGHVSTLVTSV